MKRLQRFLSSLLLVAMLCSTVMVPSASADLEILINGDEDIEYVYVGQTYKVRLYPKHGYNSITSYKVNNSKIATIDNTTGILTPLLPGTVQITVVYKAKNGKHYSIYKYVTVRQRAESLLPQEDEIYISPGQTYTLSVFGAPKTTRDCCKFGFSGNWSNIVTVDPSWKSIYEGCAKTKITGVSEGTQIINI